ncbi:MAG: hypothetical protein ACI9SJ_001740 [Flavobacteriaceae bacterium]|jgi:hypothetical protein|uniref:type IX secretion system protein PorG n=1 Tax=Candidatus Marifrigoribacter sp. Uisw_064 TaxID=3230970 RepID=UPI003AEC753D
MKHFIVLLLISIVPFMAQSQTYEIGAFIGGANYIGDLGNTSYISPNTTAFGAIFKWNRSARHAFRGSITRASIEGNDADADDVRRRQRGYNFKNTVTELSVGLEYTFWDFNMYGGQPVSTPYLYTGLTYFFYDALSKNDVNNVISKYDSAASMSIPMVVGYKAYLGGNLVLGFEIGARYTFTDDLDGSNPIKGLEDNKSLKFGNIDSNDWYVFTGLTLTFTFGRQPCYCNF